MTSGERTAAAIGSVVSGLLGVGTVVVFPTLAFLLGLVAIATGAYVRRGVSQYRLTATVGLVLGTIAVAAVLLIVVFLS
jgi:hypothetical protein